MKKEEYLMRNGMTMDDLGDFFDLWDFAHNEKLILKDNWLYFMYRSGDDDDDDDSDVYTKDHEVESNDISFMSTKQLKSIFGREFKYPSIFEGKFRFTFLGNGTILLQTVAKDIKEIRIKYFYQDNKYPEVEFRQFVMSNIKERKKG